MEMKLSNNEEKIKEEIYNLDEDFEPNFDEIRQDSDNKEEEKTEDKEEQDVEEKQEDKQEEDEKQEEDKEEKQKEEDDGLEVNINDTSIKFTKDEIYEQFGELYKKVSIDSKLNNQEQVNAIEKFLSENNISEEDLATLVEANKGSKEAIAKILDKNDIDSYDIDKDKGKEYKPKLKIPKVEKRDELDYVLDSIKDDEHFNKTNKIILDVFDEESRVVLSNNPQSIKILHREIGNGNFDKVYAEANKSKIRDITNGSFTKKSDIEYYIEAEKKILANNKFEKKKQNVNTISKKQNEKIEKVSIGKTSQSSTNSKEFDYYGDDKAFEEFYKKFNIND